MKTLFFYGLISLISWGISHAQDKSKDVSNNCKVESIIDKQPEFPGGFSKLEEYTDSEIKKAKKKMKKRKGPKVVVGYRIDETGKVRNVKVVNGVSGKWAEEAMRIVREMPDWKPGELKGRPLNVSMAIGLRFNK